MVISNGYGKYPLASAAVEAHDRGFLDAFITGAYPKGKPRRSLEATPLRRKYRGFLARQVALPESVVYDLWLPEVIHEAARLAVYRRPAAVSDLLTTAAHMAYGRSASRVLEKLHTMRFIYHYRSGFGGKSLETAERAGAITLCDHTIVHPATLDYLIRHEGRMPSGPIRNVRSHMWRGVLADVQRADHVVVNSEFVRDTFANQEFPIERVHVVPWGVDDGFLHTASRVPERVVHDGPLRLLFAGSVERRKGAHVLCEALKGVTDVPWRLDVLGGLEPWISHRYKSFFEDPRVRLHGTVPRVELSRYMCEAEVFIFPSLAEGSARVVMEAMALGCFIITTPNSGSIIHDPENGLLVAPGDPSALAAAIRRAASLGPELVATANRNRQTVLTRFRQRDFGEALERLYLELAEHEQQRVGDRPSASLKRRNSRTTLREPAQGSIP